MRQSQLFINWSAWKQALPARLCQLSRVCVCVLVERVALIVIHCCACLDMVVFERVATCEGKAIVSLGLKDLFVVVVVVCVFFSGTYLGRLLENAWEQRTATKTK